MSLSPLGVLDNLVLDEWATDFEVLYLISNSTIYFFLTFNKRKQGGFHSGSSKFEAAISEELVLSSPRLFVAKSIPKFGHVFKIITRNMCTTPVRSTVIL